MFKWENESKGYESFFGIYPAILYSFKVLNNDYLCLIIYLNSIFSILKFSTKIFSIFTFLHFVFFCIFAFFFACLHFFAFLLLCISEFSLLGSLFRWNQKSLSLLLIDKKNYLKPLSSCTTTSGFVSTLRNSTWLLLLLFEIKKIFETSFQLYNNLGLCCFYAQQYDMTLTCFTRALGTNKI